LARRPAGKRNVFIFVHGYNTMFSEALYRLAQMATDSDAPAVPVLFTWASRATTEGYVYDNNSATAARDQLEETIRLAFGSGADQVSILAHSMGNW
ncbi:alpha/beta hydrolase, partial [Streptococcus pneumoniae]|nr:alpha/beta hydrolase [Streptococcus pneumoniae]